MTKDNIFYIYLFGFNETHTRVFKNICWLSNSRIRIYNITNNISKSKIILLNIDNPQTINFWKYTKHNQNTSNIIPVWVGSQESKSDKQHCIYYPIVASQVLSELDQIAVADYHYAPELTIAENSDTSLFTSLIHENIDKNIDKINEVLVVDDSMTIRKQIEIELTGLNIPADYAESGEQALELILKNRYKLIFMDVVMPGIDGYKTCKIIRSNKNNRNINIVMLTSRSSPFDKLRGTLAGCVSYLTKPVSHDNFFKTVDKYYSQTENNNSIPITNNSIPITNNLR